MNASKRLKTVKPQPPMPVSYVDAVTALTRCCSIDDAAAFSDSAEALAVWARIYKHDEAGKQARRLKLHAYRRMGQLARELSPVKSLPGGGRTPGPIAELKSHGLSRHSADAANHLAKMGENNFSEIVDQDAPPAPTTVVRGRRTLKNISSLAELRRNASTPFNCSEFIEHYSPGSVAKTLSRRDVDSARAYTDRLIRWLQLFNKSLLAAK